MIKENNKRNFNNNFNSFGVGYMPCSQTQMNNIILNQIKNQSLFFFNFP